MKSRVILTLAILFAVLALPALVSQAAPLAGPEVVSGSNHAANAPLPGATVIQVTPTSGRPGTEVRIQGAGFTATSVVMFGATSLPPSSVTLVAPTQLRAIVPQLTGRQDVRVVTGSVTSAPDEFSVLGPVGRMTLMNATATNLPAHEALSLSGLFADAEGDGDLDLFVSEQVYEDYFRKMRLLINDGAGSFRDETNNRMPLIRGRPGSARSGDVDGDGDTDILPNTVVGHTPPSHNGSLFINDGAGRFTDEWASRVPRVECPQGDLGDVDGDGDLDLVLPCHYADTLFLNNGQGIFTSGTNLPFPTDGNVFTAFGDVDDDGDLDILAAWSTGNANFRGDLLWINDGHGRFIDRTTAQLPDSTGVSGKQVFLADLDGDRDLDGIVLTGSYEDDYMLVNDGTGYFTRSPHLLPSVSINWYLASAGDVDSDGDIDFVFPDPVGDWTETASIMVLNDGTGRFAVAPPNAFPYLRGACLGGGEVVRCSGSALGDVNNDGAHDLFLARGAASGTVLQSLLFVHREPYWRYLPLIRHGG